MSYTGFVRDWVIDDQPSYVIRRQTVTPQEVDPARPRLGRRDAGRRIDVGQRREQRAEVGHQGIVQAVGTEIDDDAVAARHRLVRQLGAIPRPDLDTVDVRADQMEAVVRSSGPPSPRSRDRTRAADGRSAASASVPQGRRRATSSAGDHRLYAQRRAARPRPGWSRVDGEPRPAGQPVAAAPDRRFLRPVRRRRIPRPAGGFLPNGGEKDRPARARRPAQQYGAHVDHRSRMASRRPRASPAQPYPTQSGIAARNSMMSDGVSRLPARVANRVISYAAVARSVDRSATTPSTDPLPSALIRR